MVTQGPSIALCTLAHIGGPGCHTFSVVAAVGRGKDEKGDQGRDSAAGGFLGPPQSGTRLRPGDPEPWNPRRSPFLALPSASPVAEHQSFLKYSAPVSKQLEAHEHHPASTASCDHDKAGLLALFHTDIKTHISEWQVTA